jgi:hypothetical protein
MKSSNKYKIKYLQGLYNIFSPNGKRLATDTDLFSALKKIGKFKAVKKYSASFKK